MPILACNIIEEGVIMGSSSDKLSGKAKKSLGKVTGNKEMEAKGAAQEAKGKAEEEMDKLSDRF